MSFLFISHASADKDVRIRPLVEVLLAEGELVWVDRPGVGAGNLGLEQELVDRARVEYLASGQPWPRAIQEALVQSGAVIACLSRAVIANAGVLRDELTFAHLAGKLVTCIVDDLSHEEMHAAGNGLLDFSSIQSYHIDCALLSAALVALPHVGHVEALPSEMREEWNKVRHLIASADRLRLEPRSMRANDLAPGAEILCDIPVGPILHVRHFPSAVLEAFAAAIDTPDRVEAALSQAQTMLGAAFPQGFTERQIFVRKGQLPALGSLSPEAFWTQLFAVAGLKGRRTVASFLVCPIGRWAVRRAGCDDVVVEFLSELTRPGSFNH